MRHSTWSRALLLGAMVVGCLAAAGAALGAEPAREFLEGLRERGYHDMALAYLDQMRTSPRCPEDFKEVIDYETGVTLVSLSRQPGPVETRLEHLSAARRRFRNFTDDHPNHPLVAAANTQLGNVLVERGRINVLLASQRSKSDADKKKLMADARKLYQEAQKVFQEAERRMSERAKPFQGVVLDPARDAEKIRQRDQAHNDLIQAKLYLVQVVYEIGKTYEPGSKPFKENLNKAAQQYRDLYDKYDRWFGGLYARMQEGRVYKELGDIPRAINILEEMLVLPGDKQALRILKTQSLILLLESYLACEPKRLQDAVRKVDEWERSVTGAEGSSPEGLKIHYLGGVACMELAESLKPNDPKRIPTRAAARKHFDLVARYAGELQREARARLLELSGESPDEAPEPADYVDAKDRADFALANMEIAKAQVEQAVGNQDRAEAARQMDDARDQAIRYYRTALAMKPADLPVSELNSIRFRLAYLYWSAEDWHRAAVLGEFLARRYPHGAEARKGAEIAVKAYRNLFTEALARSEDQSFEIKHMNELADYITTRWPDEPEAEEARMMLIATAVDRGNWQAAVDYLNKIPLESALRGQAELRTGQALWAAYVIASSKQDDERPPQAELNQMANQAQETLLKGVQRMRKSAGARGEISYLLARSVLALAAIYVATGRPEEAANWLEDAKVGPLTLVQAGASVTMGKDAFIEDTYRTALQAYVGSRQLEKAEAAMSALEKTVAQAGDAEANKRLTQIFIRLGRQLQEQLTRLRKEDKTEEVERVSHSFELFLARAADRQQDDFASLNWVAETLFGIAAGLDPGSKDLPPEAADYYKRAYNKYLAILRLARDDPSFASPEDQITVKRRMAACLRPLGEEKLALGLLIGILRRQETRLDVQIEAARTYQHWALQNPGYYRYAINGGQKVDGRNLIWGWGGIARRVAPFMGPGTDGQKYEQAFHEARYNLAACRYRLALSQTGSRRVDTFKMAELDITRVYQLYPTMGGPQWYKKYDTLLKKIQTALNKRPDGLKGPPGSVVRSARTTTRRSTAASN